ncbi:MAG: DUF2865 domain-containing protein [Pseudomonadota bacterium]
MVTAARVLDDNSWVKALRSDTYWRKKRKKKVSAKPVINFNQRSSLGRIVRGTRSSGAAPFGKRRRSLTRQRTYSSTYRTVCVRLCDGYYYPISPSTTRGRFNRDSGRCASSCAAPTRLYYHRAAGSASEMVDLSGRKYVRLPTAFLYRTAYNGNCQCRAQPWSKEAKDSHQIYALQKERKKKWRNKKRRRQIAREIKSLRKTIRTAKADRKKAGKAETKTVLSAIDEEERTARLDKYVVTTVATPNAAVIWRGDLAAAVRDDANPKRKAKASKRPKPKLRASIKPRRKAKSRRRISSRVVRRLSRAPRYRLGARVAKKRRAPKRRTAARRASKPNWKQSVWNND